MKTTVKYFIAILAILVPFSYLEGSNVVLKDGLKVKVITKAKHTSVREKPDINEPTVDTIERFSFLYVFEDNLSSTNGRTKNGFYKVGKTISDNAILGWVYKKQVLEWCHRECIKFTPMDGREPAKIYDSEDTIIKSLRSGEPNDYRPISEEIRDLGNNSFKMLLPIIKKKSVNVNGKFKKIYNIAYLHSDNENIVREHRQLDIVFVMDTTRSMQNYIDGLKSVVAILIDDISKQGTDDVQFGFIGYRDRMKDDTINEKLRIIKDSNEMYNSDAVYRYSPLTDNYDIFLDRLKNVKEANVSSGDLPEAMLDGLYAAVGDAGKTGWRPGALKVVVLIGDCSGHEQDDPIKNRHSHTIDKILNMAVVNKIRIIAIKIKGNENIDIQYKIENQKHERQMRKLAEGAEVGTSGAYTSINHSSNKSGEFKDVLIAQIKIQFKLSEKLEKFAKESREDKKLERPPEIPEAEWTTILYNLNPSLASKGEASFSTGWVCEKQGWKMVVVPHVFMTSDELQLMLHSFRRIKIFIKNAIDKITVSSTESITGLSGEKMGKNETVKSFMEKALNLPVKTRLLDFTEQDLRNESERKLKDIVKSIDLKRKSLQEFYDDQNNWYRINDDFTIGFVPISLLP